MIDSAPETFRCNYCGCVKPVQANGGTGYAEVRDKPGVRMCYECCAVEDRGTMDRDGRITLYLTRNKAGAWEITNWPGTLRFPARVRVSWHNIGRERRDAWFMHAGHVWHCVNAGDSQIAHCKRTKSTSLA